MSIQPGDEISWVNTGVVDRVVGENSYVRTPSGMYHVVPVEQLVSVEESDVDR